MKFHINGKGDVRPCSATVGACPWGTAEEHYATAEDARAAYEEAMSAVPEMVSMGSNASAAAYQQFSPAEPPLTEEEEEEQPIDPLLEENLPPEEYRGLSPQEEDALMREEWEEHRAHQEHREWERRNKWSGF